MGKRRILRVLLCVVCLGIGGSIAPSEADAKKRGVVKLDELAKQLKGVEQTVANAEQAATEEAKKTAEYLARRLVEGQLKLAEGDPETAAILFLDLMENHANTPAAPQAVHFLGRALTKLDMPVWAAELFAQNLRDRSAEARRFHQKSVARLFDLAIPRRGRGFARRPGMSATPEIRARLISVGLPIGTEPIKGVVAPEDIAKLVRWTESFKPKARDPELRYAYARYLYLAGENQKAIAELDSMSPVDIPLSRGGPNAKWRVRAAYVSAAAALADGDVEDALDRFARITRARPKDPNDRQVVWLAWLALGRVHHDERNWADSVRAYRRISRDSPFFTEAMYETAWTLLRARRYDRAVQALDRLLKYDENSPIGPEIKQLRGKIKIQQRDYQAAEEEFLALRREFHELGGQLGRKLDAKGDASKYFGAVIGEQMRHFGLDAVLPVGALPIARNLRRATQTESIARQVGELDHELTETENLLARMEDAVKAKDRARLFTDLGAHMASLDRADDELMEVQEDIVRRAGARIRRSALETRRLQLRAKVEEPLAGQGGNRSGIQRRVNKMKRQADKLELSLAELRAQLVATERYFDETYQQQKIDHQAFLNQAAELRDMIAVLERQVGSVRERIRREDIALRYTDPWHLARQTAIEEYRVHLTRMYSDYGTDAEATALWKQADQLAARAGAARERLDRAAAVRLAKAIAVIDEEKINLQRYRVELTGVTDKTKSLGGEVLAASYRDVVGELESLVMRSEVGLLDVSWSMKEVEAQEVRRLERDRDRDISEVDRAMEQGLEDLE